MYSSHSWKSASLREVSVWTAAQVSRFDLPGPLAPGPCADSQLEPEIKVGRVPRRSVLSTFPYSAMARHPASRLPVTNPNSAPLQRGGTGSAPPHLLTPAFREPVQKELGHNTRAAPERGPWMVRGYYAEVGGAMGGGAGPRLRLVPLAAKLKRMHFNKISVGGREGGVFGYRLHEGDKDWGQGDRETQSGPRWRFFFRDAVFHVRLADRP